MRDERHLVRVFVVHDHAERPHQGPGNVPLPEADAAGEPPIPPFPDGPARRCSRLGGLLRHDRRAA